MRTSVYSKIGKAHRQGGFTLVELSVAMVIALFLVAGLFTLEQSTRKTSAQQRGLAELQDRQRLAMTIMTDVIQAAGFFADPTLNTATGSLPTAPALFATAGQGVYGTTTAGQPDSIYVQYMSQGPVLDNMILCNGQQAPAAAPGVAYINQFTVQPPVGATLGQLRCTVSTNVASVVAALPNQPVVLVEGVENLQILYGVATQAASGRSVDTYMTAAQVDADLAAGKRWLDVSAVKIILTFTNPLRNEKGQNPTVTFERVIGIMNRTGA